VTGIGHGVINGVRGNCWIMSGLGLTWTILMKSVWTILDRSQLEGTI
jgi:hypothetical protein